MTQNNRLTVIKLFLNFILCFSVYLSFIEPVIYLVSVVISGALKAFLCYLTFNNLLIASIGLNLFRLTNSRKIVRLVNGNLRIPQKASFFQNSHNYMLNFDSISILSLNISLWKVFLQLLAIILHNNFFSSQFNLTLCNQIQRFRELPFSHDHFRYRKSNWLGVVYDELQLVRLESFKQRTFTKHVELFYVDPLPIQLNYLFKSQSINATDHCPIHLHLSNQTPFFTLNKLWFPKTNPFLKTINLLIIVLNFSLSVIDSLSIVFFFNNWQT